MHNLLTQLDLLARDWESHNLKVHVSTALEYSTRLLHEL
jgi:hypothetical protein